jgi:two-component system, chemotaxis family, sensor kinase CheA
VPNDRFLSMFYEEARELLQALEGGLVELEAKQGDRAHLDRTFRAAHTLKGAAGMVGLAGLAEFTHRIEAVLDKVRAGKLGVSPEVITTLLAAKDHLAASVSDQEEGRSTDAPPDLVAALDALVQGGPPVAEALPELKLTAEPGPEARPTGPEARAYRIALTPRRDLLRKGINPLGMLDELRELGTVRVVADWDRVPPLDELDALDCYLAWTIELTTAAPPEQVEGAFLFLDDPSQVAIEPLDGDAPDHTEPAPAPEPAAPKAEVQAAPKPVQAPRVRVDADQLDQLVGMAGELAVLTDSLQGLGELDGAGRWAPTLEALERLGRRLRDETLELRMVPIEELFLRFPRVVRDLSEKSGKQIALRIEGQETRLDRTIIERLFDPMIHLIRNAVDHGLETPEQRRDAGKTPTGRITIGAGHEGDRVAIRIEDDGRGLDRARIARKGIALGMIPPDTPPDDPRVVNLIFEPGFSTRDKAGELSGRGVGLDVVRDALRNLRGRVTLRSVEGRGTTFLLYLPLTLAMIDGLLVESDGGRYVVPMGQVDECVALEADGAATTMGRPAAVVRGDLIPIISMGGASPSSSDGGRHELLLTRHAEQRVAVAVDRLLGRVQAVIQPLDEGLHGLKRYSGATILGDGSISLILDLATLIAEARAAERIAAAPSPS